MDMNPFGTASGGSLSDNAIPSISGGAGKDIFSLMFLYPEFGQFLQAAFAQGKNVNEALAPFMVTGKAGKKAFKQNPQGFVKGGKGVFYNLGEMGAALPGELEGASQYKINQMQKQYETLKSTPAFATLAAQAEGKFDDEYMTSVDQAFGKIASGSLGAAASQGFLSDTNKLTTALLPASEGKAQFLTMAKEKAQSTLQALAGFPSAGSFSPGGLLGGQSSGILGSGMLGAADLWLKGQIANQGAASSYDAMKMAGAQWGWGTLQDMMAGAAAGGGWV